MNWDPATFTLALPVAGIAAMSLLLAGFLVATASLTGAGMDIPAVRLQALHATPAARLGGVGIYLALLCALPLLPDPQVARMVGTLLFAGLPALAVGLLEDMTHRVSPNTRLLGTFISGVLACWISGVAITGLGIPVLDQTFRFGPWAVVFTAFAICGVANALNIVDGFHGLASGTAAIGLLAVSGIAVAVNDATLAVTCLVLIGSIAGFWVVNFPWGKLFLGDGGAYFAGFSLAWMAVLLPARNPDVSPWASLLVCAYPVLEALYSIARRLARHASAMQADREHLHTLVAQKIVLPRTAGWSPALQNAGVSVVMWICAAIPALAGVMWFNHTPLLIGSAVSSLLLYHLFYRRISA